MHPHTDGQTCYEITKLDQQCPKLNVQYMNIPIKSKVFFDDDLKIMSQDKRHSLSPYTKLDLEVTKEVSIVNVEELATLCHHDVVRVTVSNTQHVCSNTVTSTRPTETLSCLLQSATKTLQCKYHCCYKNKCYSQALINVQGLVALKLNIAKFPKQTPCSTRMLF